MGRGPVAGWRETWLHQTCSLAVFAWLETRNDRRRQIQAHTHRHTHTLYPTEENSQAPCPWTVSLDEFENGKNAPNWEEISFPFNWRALQTMWGIQSRAFNFFEVQLSHPFKEWWGKKPRKKMDGIWVSHTRTPPWEEPRTEGGMETTKLWLRKSYWYLRVKLRERKIAQAWDGERENAGGRSLFSEQEDQQQTCGGWKTTWER